AGRGQNPRLLDELLELQFLAPDQRMLSARDDRVRLVRGERFVQELIGTCGVEHPPHDDVEISFQEPLHELPAGIDLNGDEDTGVALLHPRYRQRYEVGTGIQDSADGGLA